MDLEKLRSGLPKTAFAFRGYNLENLGRSPELLAHPAYGPVLERHLRRATFVCRQVTGRPVDLIQRVQSARETTLDEYAEAIALIVAVEMAQLEILEHCFEMRYEAAQVAFGFSLGEVTALIASGVLDFDSALMVPLSLADDCVDLARDVTLAVLFSRGPLLAVDEVQRMCVLINSQGRGVIGISAVLSPNSVLLMGQADTLDRFAAMMPEVLPQRVYLRRNQGRWPPMHTPIVWERAIPNRAASLMHAIPGGFTKPQPPILSMVTGKMSYNEYNTRHHLHQWTDHPQKLWDAVYQTLAMGVQTVIHVGPGPNIIPATYKRLKDNVEVQTKGSIGLRALLAAAGRPWLASLLPQRSALLRAPHVRHVFLEDWLLDEAPQCRHYSAARIPAA